MKKKLILCLFFTAVLCISIFENKDRKTHTNTLNTIVFASHGKPFSFDPIKSDITSNFFPSYMLFSRPLEISPDSKLSSDVLESFTYDSASRTVQFVLKTGIFFSNGDAITADDVAFSIARGIASYPTMPTVRHIEGLSEWLKTKKVLTGFPSGINVSGQVITIKYSKEVNYPLFRFTIPIFGIVPRKCVDTVTNEMACIPLVSSGRYSIGAEDDNSIIFKYSAQKNKHRSNFKFEYTSLESALRKYKNKKNVVIHSFYFKNDADIISKFPVDTWKVRILPKSRIVGIVINPLVSPFDDIICRQVFADLYREAIAFDLLPSSRESSFWPAIGSGYISNEKLSSRRKYSKKDQSACENRIISSKLKIAIAPDMKFSDNVRSLLTRLGLFSDPITYKNRVDAFMDFTNQKTAFTAFTTGFWPIDPFGDAEILFSENLNPVAWTVKSDTYLQNTVGQFSLPTPPADLVHASISLNEHIFDQAVFNVYSHNSFALTTPDGEILKRYQESVSDPMPWQLFEDEDGRNEE